MSKYNWSEIIKNANKKFKSKFCYDESGNVGFQEYTNLVLEEAQIGSLKDLLDVLKKKYSNWCEDKDINDELRRLYDMDLLRFYDKSDYLGFLDGKKCSSMLRQEYDFFIQKTPKENILIENWKKILNDVLCSKLSIRGVEHYRTLLRFEESGRLSRLDSSSLLALKTSLNNQYIFEKDNSITLVLSGGMMANIQIRKLPSSLKKEKLDKIELFYISQRILYSSSEVEKILEKKHGIFLERKNDGIFYGRFDEYGHFDEYGRIDLYGRFDENDHFYEYDRFDKGSCFRIYEQKGHTTSSLNIYASPNFLILTNEWIVEITFDSAPILFGSSNPVLKFYDMSSASKIEEERRREEEEEEERRRRRREEEEW